MKRRLLHLAVVAVLFPVAAMAQEFYGATFGVTISNNAGRQEYLVLGVAQGASSGIDALLGEYELPPPPPAEVFDARIQSTPGKSQLGSGARFDYRQIASTTTAFSETYTIAWQAGEGQSNVKITWDLPLASRVTGVKIDGVSIAGKTEITTQFAQGQVVVEVTYNYKALSFKVNPTSLSFDANNRDPLPSKTLEVTPEGETTAPWVISSDVDWINVDPPTGSGQTSVTVSISDPRLAAGSYTGTITVRSPNEPVKTEVPVTLQMLVGVGGLPTPSGMMLYGVLPNPAAGPLRIELDAGDIAATPVLTIHNILGATVADLSLAVHPGRGRQIVNFDAGVLPPGVYTCRLADGATTRTLRLVIIR